MEGLVRYPRVSSTVVLVSLANMLGIPHDSEYVERKFPTNSLEHIYRRKWNMVCQINIILFEDEDFDGGNDGDTVIDYQSEQDFIFK